MVDRELNNGTARVVDDPHHVDMNVVEAAA